MTHRQLKQCKSVHNRKSRPGAGEIRRRRQQGELGQAEGDMKATARLLKAHAIENRA